MDHKRVEGWQFRDDKVFQNRTGIKRLIKDMHAMAPKYIFLTETSATAWGLVFKEALRKAYPNDPLPKFYRVDPQSLFNIPYSEKSKQKWKEYLQERRIDSKDKILVFDEEFSRGVSMNRIKNAFENESGRYGDHHFKNITYIEGNVGILEKRTDGKIIPNKRSPPNFYGIHGGILSDQNGDYPNFRLAIKKREPALEPLKFTGDLIHKPNQRHRDVYQEIKSVGKEIGEELHAELQKNKSLEQLSSSATAVVAFIGSLFFTTSNLTGNVISNLSINTTNLTGIILFLIGLVATFFYIKRK